MDYIVHEVAKNGHAERLSLSRVFFNENEQPLPLSFSTLDIWF